MITQILVWLLPIGLLVFIGFRLFASSKKGLQKNYLIFFCVAIAAVVVLILIKHDFFEKHLTTFEGGSTNYPLTLTPQDFDRLINLHSENAKAEIFYEKGFEPKDLFIDESMREALYPYVYNDNQYCYSHTLGQDINLIVDKKCFDDFFEYLKKNQAGDAHTSFELNERYQDKQVLKYGECIYAGRGFDRKLKLYQIDIFSVLDQKRIK